MLVPMQRGIINVRCVILDPRPIPRNILSPRHEPAVSIVPLFEQT